MFDYPFKDDTCTAELAPQGSFDLEIPAVRSITRNDRARYS